MQFLRSQLRLGFHASFNKIPDLLNFVNQSQELLDVGFTSGLLDVSEEVLDTSPSHARNPESVIRQLSTAVDRWRKSSAYLLVRDNPLFCLALNATGLVVRYRAGIGVSRLREVIGTKRFLGLQISSPVDCDKLCNQFNCQELDDVDFLVFEQPITKSQLPQKLLRFPTVTFADFNEEIISQWPVNFADGVLVPYSIDNKKHRAQKLHLALAQKLGPSRFSAGAGPDLPSFQFEKLSKAELSGYFIPNF